MKKLAVLITAGVSLWAGSALPGHAAGPYTIAGPGLGGSADGASRFVTANCNPALVGSAADGIDSRIVDVANRANTILNITWTAEPHVAGNLNGQLTARFYSAACSGLPVPPYSSKTPGLWSVPVPVGAKWMIVLSTNEAQVQFSYP